MKTQIYENKTPMRQWAMDDLPSEKYLTKGSSNLSDAELLSIIIGTGIPGENSLDIARNILMKYDNNLNELSKVSASDLQKIRGIGWNKAVKISAVFSLARRRNESETLFREFIKTSRDAFQIFDSVMRDLIYEEFWILLLNRANRLIRKAKISDGGVSGTVVDLKRIFRICLDFHASCIVLGHNHPSGSLQPSDADKSLTTKIKNSGLLMDISVLDHIIVGNNAYYSFADEGAL